MVDLCEALEALRAAREVSDLPVIVEMTFDRKPRGFFTLMGDTPAAAAEALLAEGADGVGANCSLMAEDMIDLAAELRAATDAPILVQPNCGGESATFCCGTVDAVGGCCGCGPEHIRALAELLRGGRG
jgi:5-methyltetrahydrofolate--homocysteine methyltransferase